MRKILIVAPLVVMLAACGTTDRFAKIADQEREVRIQTQEKN